MHRLEQTPEIVRNSLEFCRTTQAYPSWLHPFAPLPLHPMWRTPAVSFFEVDGQAYFNSVALADADGRVLGRYRKSHIPDGPGQR